MQGWVAHGFTDIWMDARPAGGSLWALCPTCGVWMALQQWEKYRFTRNETHLVQHTLPLFAGAIEFFLDYLEPVGDEGVLATGPSHSPENSFRVSADVLGYGVLWH